MNDDIISMQDISVKLGGHWVHKNLNLSVKTGEILGIVGGSGSGKTTLLREMVWLQRPNMGSIRVFNQELTTASPVTLRHLQARWGVLFQSNALFSSLTVLENTVFPLKEHTNLDEETMYSIAKLKIILAGLSLDAAVKYPSELSGGMQKRAGLARSIALDPELIFLDEPTAGLDPCSASALDELVLHLQQTMGLTVVMITHDLDTLWRITDRVAFLGEGGVLCVDAIENLIHHPHPLIQAFFSGSRGARAQHGNQR